MDTSTGQRTEGQSALRRINTSAVLRALRAATEPQRATELATYTGLTRPTIITILSSLLDAGVIREAGQVTLGGRPSPTFAIRAAAFPVVGVDVGASRVAVRLAALDGEVLATAQSREVPREGSQVLHTIASLVEDVARAAQVPVHRLSALCLAAPGVMNAERVVESRPFLRWVQTDLINDVAGLLGVPVELENDANAAAIALRNVADLPPSYIALQWGHRLGAGIMLDGALHRGSNGTAGEIGGLLLNGSSEGLEHRVSTATFLGEGHGDASALKRRDVAVEAVADAVAPACGMLGLRHVVLSGGSTHGGQPLADALTRALAARGLGGAHCSVSPFGDDTVLAGATGAAADQAWNRLTN